MIISNIENRLIQKKYFGSLEAFETYRENVYIDSIKNNIELIHAAKDSNTLISYGHREMGRTVFGYRAYLKTKKYDLGNIYVNYRNIDDRDFKADLYLKKIKLDLEYDGTVGHDTLIGYLNDMKKNEAVQSNGQDILRMRSGSLEVLPTSKCIIVRDNQFLINNQIEMIESLNDKLGFWYYDAKNIVTYINNHDMYKKGLFLFEHEKDRLIRIIIKSNECQNRINKQPNMNFITA